MADYNKPISFFDFYKNIKKYKTLSLNKKKDIFEQIKIAQLK